MVEALIDYAETECCFPDCLLMSMGRGDDRVVWSFNKHDFEQLEGTWGIPE